MEICFSQRTLVKLFSQKLLTLGNTRSGVLVSNAVGNNGVGWEALLHKPSRAIGRYSYIEWDALEERSNLLGALVGGREKRKKVDLVKSPTRLN